MGGGGGGGGGGGLEYILYNILLCEMSLIQVSQLERYTSFTLKSRKQSIYLSLIALAWNFLVPCLFQPA